MKANKEDMTVTSYNAEYYQANRERIIANAKRYYDKHREERLQYAKKYRIENPEKVRYAGSRGKDKQLYWNRWRNETKSRVFSHYGDGKIECSICGYSDIRALCLHHVNGGGTAHRERVKLKGSLPFYVRLERDGFPEGLEVLCANCHQIKHSGER
jgi:hypothetical protein